MRGFSLLEMVISLSIAMLLLVAVAQIGVFVGQLWLQQEASMNRVEALNVAYAWMGRDIESAGYFGCLKQGLRHNWEDPLHLLMSSELAFSGAVMTLQYMSPETSALISKISPYEWVVNNSLAFAEGDEIVIENCTNIAINRIATLSHQGDDVLLVLEAPIFSDFEDSAFVGYLRQRDYQIKTTSRKAATGEAITSLYVLDHHEWQELLEAVRVVVWYRSGSNITMQLTMMDDSMLTLQVQQKNAA